MLSVILLLIGILVVLMLRVFMTSVQQLSGVMLSADVLSFILLVVFMTSTFTMSVAIKPLF